MEQNLKLYSLINGAAYAFPNEESQIEVNAFSYSASRMGDAPVISTTIYYPTCLDNVWTGNEYVLYDGEFYFLKGIPASSFDNTDVRYKHECSFVNERSILNGVLFTDAVSDEEEDKPVSNSSSFSFFGTINEFVYRLNASLRYANLQRVEGEMVFGYEVVLDDSVSSLENYNKSFHVSFQDSTMAQAIQEIYNSFNIPYYFREQTIHVGVKDENSYIDKVFKYGVNDSLISITKNSKGNKIVNRITAVGSTENIPYYYPNETEKGSVSVVSHSDSDRDLTQYVTLENSNLFANVVKENDKISFRKDDSSIRISSLKLPDGSIVNDYTEDELVKIQKQTNKDEFLIVDSMLFVNREDDYKISFFVSVGRQESTFNPEYVTEISIRKDETSEDVPMTISGDGSCVVHLTSDMYYISFKYKLKHRGIFNDVYYMYLKSDVSCLYGEYWSLSSNPNKRYQLSDLGLKLNVEPKEGDILSQKITIGLYPNSTNLVLPIYRETQGNERFYEAINNTYEDGNGGYYLFPNEYDEKKPSEHIVKFDDIKPSIEGFLNSHGLRIDMFSEFAFDDNDNDLTSTNENGGEDYQHPYFFGKLRKLGFNLFNHAIETGDMTVSLTSGKCGACSFVIGVDEDTQKNLVQVDGSGNLLKDEFGDIRCGREGKPKETPQDIQNDTTDREVWIALKKDTQTYGVILPSSTKSLVPKACTEGNNDGDTFVFTNILLPQEYILNAEERLKDEAIKYMAQNNTEAYSFSIKFSRIFLEENKDELSEKLNENSTIKIGYNSRIYELHVTSFSLRKTNDSLLPEVSVELSEKISIHSNAIQSAVSEAKAEVIEHIEHINFIEQASPYFLRKDVDDYNPASPVFARNVKVGQNQEIGGDLHVGGNSEFAGDVNAKDVKAHTQVQVGGYVEGVSGAIINVGNDGATYMEVDKLKVRMKAYFEELEIQKVNTVGGKLIMSPAGSFKCIQVSTRQELIDRGVEETDLPTEDFYRCFFESYQDGNEIENFFVVNDLAYSQSFNAKEGVSSNVSNKRYWRKVVNVGENFIDLSVIDCEADSDIPSEQDVICQLGNSEDATRQNAIVMSSVDEFSPSITLYYGIDEYSLIGKEIIQYGVNVGTNKAFFNVYGDMYIGDNPKDGEANSYMRYTTENGLEIKGRITVGSTYGDKTFEDLISEAKPTGYDEFVAATGTAIQNLQDQIDGSITTWFYNGVPTLENLPSSDWKETEYNVHLGDLYYDGDTGKAYRFQLEEENYIWKEITDTDIQAALEAANKAQDTADNKRRVFFETPTTPYDKGDLWSKGEDAPLFICVTSKTKDEVYSEEDWGYADNSEKIAQEAKEAKAAVAALGSELGDLREETSNFKEYVDGSFKDGIVSEEERKRIGDYLNTIKTTFNEVSSSYDELKGSEFLKDSTELTTLNKAYSNFDTAYNKLTESISNVVGEVDGSDAAQVDIAFENFNSTYSSFVTALHSANNKINSVLNTNIDNKYKDITDNYDYLKNALKGQTITDGGLILTSMISLGEFSGENNTTFTTMSGVNGTITEALGDKSIAFWSGGSAIDRQLYEEDKIPEGAADFIVRMDGTGYAAGGNFSWDKDGKITANPLSFFVGEDTVGYLLSSFQVVNGDNEETKYLTPLVPFSSLTISNELEVNSIRLKAKDGSFAVFTFDGNNVFVDKAFASLGAISTKGVGSSSGGGSSFDILQSWDNYDASTVMALGANLGKELKDAIENIDISGSLEGYYTQEEVNILLSKKQDTISNLDTIIAGASLGATALQPSALDGYAKTSDIPTELKNPFALKFGEKSYDGSSEVTITATDLGALTEHQAIYSLTIQKNGIDVGTFTANSENKTINISDVASEESLNKLSDRVTAIEGWFILEDGVLKTTYPIASEGAISTKGVGSSSGGEGGTIDLSNVVSNITPSVDSTYSIGSTTNAWKNVYADSIYMSGNLVATSGDLDTLRGSLGSLAFKSSLVASDIPSLDWSKITSGKPTTVSGYGITDAYTKTAADERYLKLTGGTIDGSLSVEDSLEGGIAVFSQDLTAEWVVANEDLTIGSNTLDGNFVQIGTQSVKMYPLGFDGNENFSLTYELIPQNNIYKYKLSNGVVSLEFVDTFLQADGLLVAYSLDSRYFSIYDDDDREISYLGPTSSWIGTDLTVGGSLSVTLSSMFTGVTTHNGGAQIYNNLLVSLNDDGATELFSVNSNGTSVGGSLSVASSSTIGDTLTVTNTIKLNDGTKDTYSYIKTENYSVNTARLVFGSCYGYAKEKDALSIFNGNVSIGIKRTGDDYKLYVNGNTYVNGTLSVVDAATFNSSVKIGDATLTYSNGVLMVDKPFASTGAISTKGIGTSGSGGSTIDVINNLTSTSTTDALSAYQGNLLNQYINELEESLNGYATLEDAASVISAERLQSSYSIKVVSGQNGAYTTATIDSYTGLGYNLDTVDGVFLADHFLVFDILDYIDEKVPTISVTQTLTSGTKIGSINVNGTTTNLYAPTGGSVDLSNYVTLSGEQDISGAKTFSSKITAPEICGVENYSCSVAFGDEDVTITAGGCIICEGEIQLGSTYQHYLQEDGTAYLSSLTLDTALPIASGGTGATSASAARTALGLGSAATRSYTTSVTSGSSSLVTSGGVYTYIDNKNFLTSHQTIYNLTFSAGTFSSATFDPNGSANTVYIPTKTSHLENDKKFQIQGNDFYLNQILSFGRNGACYMWADGGSSAYFLFGVKGAGTTSYANAAFRILTNSNVEIRRNLTVGEEITQGSDITRKNVIEDARISLSSIAYAPLFRFTWNNNVDGIIHIGTSAQYWQVAAKEFVRGTEGVDLGLDYASLGVAMGISLGKEMLDMLTRVDNNESEIDKLKARVEALENENKELRELLN